MEMDRPSIMFAHILDGMVVIDADDHAQLLVCKECTDTVCAIEDSDSLRVLLNTALAHQCGK